MQYVSHPDFSPEHCDRVSTTVALFVAYIRNIYTYAMDHRPPVEDDDDGGLPLLCLAVLAISF